MSTSLQARNSVDVAKPASRGSGERRDPARTREQILQAAIVEFSVNGFAGARIDKIAARAGANKRMIYHYYGNKDDLFQAVMERTYDDIRTKESQLSLSDMDPQGAMRRLVEFSFGYFTENPHFTRLLNIENLYRARHIKGSQRVRKMHSPLVEMIEDILARGRAKGVFRDDVDPIQLYTSVAALGYFYFSNVHTLSAIFDVDFAAPPARERRLAHIVDVIMSYLRP